MTSDTAVFENHDRLFLTKILGVPRDLSGPTSKQRWIDNYAYRYDAGRVSLREFRFGGEGAGMGGIYNFAPFACQLVQSPYSHMDLCKRIPHDSAGIPANSSIVPGAFALYRRALLQLQLQLPNTIAHHHICKHHTTTPPSYTRRCHHY